MILNIIMKLQIAADRHLNMKFHILAILKHVKILSFINYNICMII